MQRRRVALLFEYATLNGGENSILSVLDWLQANTSEFQFIAICPVIGRLPDEIRSRGVPLVEFGQFDEFGNRLPNEIVEANLQKIVRSVNPDLLHANSLAMGRLSGRIAGRLRIPTTAHLRDIIKLSKTAIADLNRNDRLIAVSMATRQFHLAQHLDVKKLVVIPNGVNLEKFAPRPQTGNLHRELGISNPTLVDESQNVHRAKLIATIGQIGLRKGQDVLANSARSIVDQVPDAHFVLIGERTSQKSESREFELSIRKSFTESGLTDRLHLLGYRNDISDMLSEFDLLVHPANQEPYGRVLLEATAAGLPVVATDVGGTSEIVSDGITGLLVPPRDPIALSNAVVSIINNRSRHESFRLAARNKAVSCFSVSVAAQKLADIWHQLLAASEISFPISARIAINPDH